MRTLTSLLVVLVLLGGVPLSAAAGDTVTCWFPPGWKSKARKAKAITEVLTEKSGVTIRPRIARSYPEILDAFSKGGWSLVYVGSFVQAVIKARGLGVPLVQTIDGREFYGAWMIYPKGKDPQEILARQPEKIAFTQGASSGESGAKAATGGKASIATSNHAASAGAVRAGKAAAAFVKNWWWIDNKSKFPELEAYQVPGISDRKNPDNVLTASNALPAEVRERIKRAALDSIEVFGGESMDEFDGSALEFSLNLMKKGGIDPLTYRW